MLGKSILFPSIGRMVLRTLVSEKNQQKKNYSLDFRPIYVRDFFSFFLFNPKLHVLQLLTVTLITS
jgi:hypothetical protein